MTTRPKPILIVGSLAFDDLDMPSGSYRNVLGGAAVYAALAASLLSPGAVRIVGIIGDDFPETHLAELRSRGIDTAGVERASGETFRWHGRYSADLREPHDARHSAERVRRFSPRFPPPTRTVH